MNSGQNLSNWSKHEIKSSPWSFLSGESSYSISSSNRVMKRGYCRGSDLFMDSLEYLKENWSSGGIIIAAGASSEESFKFCPHEMDEEREIFGSQM
jgi:hypothetical protein